MGPILKLYFKIFLFTGIPFGLISLGFDLLSEESHFAIAYLFRTIFFGFFMSLTLGTIQISKLKSYGLKHITSENLRINQHTSLQSGLSKMDLINKIKSDPVFQKMTLDETEDGIVLNASMSFWSWGEIIRINIQPLTLDLNEFKIVSSPKLKIAIIDNGKNYQNVARLKKLIEEGVIEFVK
ncbi:MAG: hypothetical protein ABIQ02_11015 [Saprospiraceae bacterium]